MVSVFVFLAAALMGNDCPADKKFRADFKAGSVPAGSVSFVGQLCGIPKPRHLVAEQMRMAKK